MIRISDLRLNDYVAHEIFKGKITRGTVIWQEGDAAQIKWEDGKNHSVGNFSEGMQIEKYLTLLTRVRFDLIFYPNRKNATTVHSFYDYNEAKKCFEGFNENKNSWRVVRRTNNAKGEIVATQTLGYSIPN